MKTLLPENDIRYSDRRHPVDFLEPLPTPEDQLQRICEVLSRTFGWVAEADTIASPVGTGQAIRTKQRR